MKNILKYLSIVVFILLTLSACGQTVYHRHDHDKKMAELDEKIKIARENTKKAEDDLRKSKERLKETQEKISKSIGDEKTKLKKTAENFQKALIKYEKEIKENAIKQNMILMDIIIQANPTTRKEAYESLDNYEYKGDILKNYFTKGDTPQEQDFKELKQEELYKIQKDLIKIIIALQ